MKQIEISTLLNQVKIASELTSQLSAIEKKRIIGTMIQVLQKSEDKILAANERDRMLACKKGATKAFIDRLLITKSRFTNMIMQLTVIKRIKNPVGEVIEDRLLSNGIRLQKKRFPLGIVFIIYESRPTVTVDVVGLCITAGNAVILKGGSEAYYTNKALYICIQEAFGQCRVSSDAVIFLENTSHKDIAAFLKRSDIIDVVIPRGNYGLVQKVRQQSYIPVLYHAAGGARIYVDKNVIITKALAICINAKAQRTGVCNALDMVLVHKDIAATFLPLLDHALTTENIEIRADKQAKRYMSHAKLAKNVDFHTEFLDRIIAVKEVISAHEAITFIKNNTQGHTEMLATNDKKVIEKFITAIDAAGLMINCSSRFHDGGEFGMGAEMGIATGKLHARGPVGVTELTTYKWIAYGNGQVRK